jgi:nucleoside-diphosphate-sugar epimerase
MAKYLITGIAGFIGSALAHVLVSEGHEVRGIDNFSTGKPENISDILDRIDFREADLLDEAAMMNACCDMDFVLHQAADPSVLRSIDDPVSTHRVNACGTLNLLLAARRSAVRRFVYASSCSVYGDAPLPNAEHMCPQPLSPYAASKLAGELYARSFYRLYGLETVGLRYFNVFGPRQDANSEYSGVIAKFIGCMLQGQSPTIYGDGEQSRDFVFVDNVVAANLLACTAPDTQVAGQVFNIGSGIEVRVKRVCRLIGEMIHFKREALTAPCRCGEIKHSFADISLARGKLGYAPKVSFEEGLQRTIRWYVQQMDSARPVEASAD